MTDPYYQDALVTLYLGDASEIQQWVDADVLITDPPYGVAWQQGGLSSERSVRNASTQSIAGDESAAVRDEVLAVWGTKPAAVFGNWRVQRPPGVRHRLIWHKMGRYPGVTTTAFFPVEEEIYILGAGWTGKPLPNVITTDEPRHLQPRKWGHPTPKPLDLMRVLVAKSPPGVISDPFAGSGATLAACREAGRACIGVELEERYCEVIALRLSQQDLFAI